MLRALRGLLTVLGMLTAGIAAAQPPATPSPAPVPASPPAAPGVVTTLPHPADVPPLLPPPPPDPAPVPLPVPDLACPCPPSGPKPGLFGGVELGILFPHVTNGLAAPVVVRPFGVTDLVMLPAVDLDSTVAPQFTLGYRLRDDLGAILLTYRNLASEGREFVRDFDFAGDGVVFSRLDINTVGLAYSTREQPLGALWGMRWEVGAKLSSIYFDSLGQGLGVGQHVTDHFVGAGPAIALDLTRELPPTGLAVYTRAEFADLWGRVTQHYAEWAGDPRQPVAFGGFDQHQSQGVPMLALQAGLSWLSHPDGRYRLTAGYSFEHYWAVGKVGATNGDVMAQGLFLRAEFNY
ncbi:MAG TPA: hypothetical protein VGF55_04965 [Gemmataceae bacterium]|jgi:hypothetical protein